MERLQNAVLALVLIAVVLLIVWLVNGVLLHH